MPLETRDLKPADPTNIQLPTLIKALHHANSSAPPCINLTNVPLSCSSSQPRSIARSKPALYSSGVPFSRNRNGPLINSM